MIGGDLHEKKQLRGQKCMYKNVTFSSKYYYQRHVLAVCQADLRRVVHRLTLREKYRVLVVVLDPKV